MDMESLEEEYKALQGDKDGEIEYFHSLEETISGMKVLCRYCSVWCCNLYKSNYQMFGLLTTRPHKTMSVQGISEPVKCCCGLEYEVELGGKTMDLS
jgi:hypothetical protein